MVAFLIVAAFLDKIELEKEGREEKKEGLSFHLLLDSLKHIWRSDYQKLLVPLTIYSGIEQAFIAGDFTRVSSNFVRILTVSGHKYFIKFRIPIDLRVCISMFTF